MRVQSASSGLRGHRKRSSPVAVSEGMALPGAVRARLPVGRTVWVHHPDSAESKPGDERSGAVRGGDEHSSTQSRCLVRRIAGDDPAAHLGHPALKHRSVVEPSRRGGRPRVRPVHRGAAVAAVRATAAIAHPVAASWGCRARHDGRDEEGNPQDHIPLDGPTPKEVRRLHLAKRSIYGSIQPRETGGRELGGACDRLTRRCGHSFS